ncbi:ATP-dependent DNA helicase srs2 [Ceratocystis lukuohia]|uniref:DNA 3'-5' helicase n=1 Tax=Ceratocystis lukuohia TaxID=2019550 RepID=A0ABR4MC01_9PEZI
MSSSNSSDTRNVAILKGLNRQQHRAVSSRSSTVAILAGPGCGKTHTLTSRVAYLVDQLGYQPWNIIVATFTVKAAREMRERIGKHLGEERQRKIVLGTFHGLAARYLAIYGHLIGIPKKFSIMDDSDGRAVIKRICKRLNLDDIDPRAVLGFISKEKSRSPYFDGEEECEIPSTQARVNASGMVVKKPHKPPNYVKIYGEYQAYLTETDMLDYDDLLVRCVELLQKHPRCVANVEAVLIDEYQDTNGMQYELLKQFASARNRITVVGDPDQSIYGWRAAEIRNLKRLLVEFPGTEEISLEENYRSSTRIVDTAIEVIKQDSQRYDKSLLPVHGKGTAPALRRLATAKDQADWLAMEICRIVDMTAKTLKLDDIAILLRSSSASRLIEAALIKKRIKYRMVGGRKFFERAEIKLIIDYLCVINQPKNNDAVSRILNTPKRGFGAKSLGDLLLEAEESKVPLWELLLKHVRRDRKCSISFSKNQEQELYKLIGLINNGRTRLRLGAEGKPFDLVKLIDYIIRTIKLQEYIQNTYKEDHETRWSNVEEFVKNAREFVDSASTEDETLPENEGVQQQNQLDMLDRFLTNIALVSEPYQENQDDEDPEKKNLGTVTISTIHAAKGLEWPVVFVPNVHNGSIPNSRVQDVAEERRLLYVAMTRAKALLYLSFPARDKSWSGDWASCEMTYFLTNTHTMFAHRGPSFTRDALNGMGEILGRSFPTVDYIYKNLPEMAITEDDHYPETPSSKRPDAEFQGDGNKDNGNNKSSKRMRTELRSGGIPNPNMNWETGYSTTMQQSTNFTVGFVSASSHHATLSSQGPTMAANKTTQSIAAKQNGSRTLVDMGFKDSRSAPQNPISATKPRTTSTSALGTGTSKTQNRTPAIRYPSTAAKPQSASSSLSASYLPPPKLADVEPELTKHSLGTTRGAVRTYSTIAAPKSKLKNPMQSPDKFPQKKGVYPQFSSSPVRPESHQPPQPSAEGADADPYDHVVVDKPAETLHRTTMTNGFGGFHRPSRIDRIGGPQTINRISKLSRPAVVPGAKSKNTPYKKLTIPGRDK